MSYEWFIGLRYLKAKKQATFISVITVISILGITVGVTALIIVLSVMTGFEEDLKSKILGINAHVIVTELGGSMEDHASLTEKIKQGKDVTGASPFIYRQAMLSAKGGVVGVILRGLDPDTVGEVTELPSRVKAGSLDGLKSGFKEAATKGELPGIVLGSELAKTLGLWTGDELNVVAPMSSAGGGLSMTTPRMARFQVVGIFELGMYEYDSNLAFVSIGNAQSFFRLGKSVTGIEVKIKDAYDADETKDELQAMLGARYPVRSWQDMNKNLFSALKLEKAAMFIILLLIIIVAALNIISTLIMVVMQKGKEIAILKSLGATSGSIMKIFMIEGIIIGVIGTCLGTLIGVGASLNIAGIMGLIESTFNFKILPPSVYYIDSFPSKVEPGVVAIIVITSLAISFLATIYPSWKASKSDPAEGIRYE
jgi:lipoprotein-releasing system permease protein